MTWSKTFHCAGMALFLALLSAGHARATTTSTFVGLPNGSFSTMLSGSGGATITGASGNYRDWTSLGIFGWQSLNVPLSASPQSVGIAMPNVNISNTVASGSANITYDNVAPGTPQSLDSLSADLNGAGGSNQNTPFSINTTSPLNVDVGNLFSVPLSLAVNGMITNATFTSSGGAAASPYLIPGTLDLTLNATVTGSISVLSTPISLGTLYTLASTTISIPTSLPGIMLLTDQSGGLGPYPAAMGVDLSATLPFSIPVPVNLPFDTNQTFPQVGHNDQLTSLVINPGSMLNLTMNLGNPSYDLNGVVPLALVPEPGSLVLFSTAAAALAFVAVRRRRRR